MADPSVVVSEEAPEVENQKDVPLPESATEYSGIYRNWTMFRGDTSGRWVATEDMQRYLYALQSFAFLDQTEFLAEVDFQKRREMLSRGVPFVNVIFSRVKRNIVGFLTRFPKGNYIHLEQNNWLTIIGSLLLLLNQVQAREFDPREFTKQWCARIMEALDLLAYSTSRETFEFDSQLRWVTDYPPLNVK